MFFKNDALTYPMNFITDIPNWKAMTENVDVAKVLRELTSNLDSINGKFFYLFYVKDIDYVTARDAVGLTDAETNEICASYRMEFYRLLNEAEKLSESETPIDWKRYTNRAAGALRRNGIKTYEALTAIPESHVTDIPDAGLKTAEEIISVTKSLGWKFAEEWNSDVAIRKELKVHPLYKINGVDNYIRVMTNSICEILYFSHFISGLTYKQISTSEKIPINELRARKENLKNVIESWARRNNWYILTAEECYEGVTYEEN